MRVACIQLEYHETESKSERVERVLHLAEGVRTSGLVVLPELWPTGYFSFERYEDEAEPLDGATVSALRELAKTNETYLLGGSFVERHGGGLANCAVFIGPQGELLLTYRKMHLFGYESREASLLTAGTELEVATANFGRVGTTTCYDLRFPEVYRVLVDRGAEVVIVPAAWPKARIEHWRLLLRARALENQVFVLGCNGVGPQGGSVLGGHSMIVDPWGDVLVEAGGGGPAILEAELDFERLKEIRAGFPVLEHRRLSVNPPPGT